MAATGWSKFELKMERERREAERTRPYRDARNDAPRCPDLQGYDKPPEFRKRGSGRPWDSGPLERRLREATTPIYADWRARNPRNRGGSGA